MYTIMAVHFIDILEDNIENPNFTDQEFREFIRHILPIVESTKNNIYDDKWQDKLIAEIDKRR